MDKIKIRGLECFGNHGVLAEEKALGQKFIINCTMHTDISVAALSKDISDTVNYAEASHFIKEYTESNTFDLIETLAENIARGILRKYNIVKSVEVEVEKPWAPIGLPLDTVSVKVKRSKANVFIALGSNMGDKRAHLDNAVRALEKHDDFRIIRVSDYIETEPYGGVQQDDFLNGVLQAETCMMPFELLSFLNDIEADEGRERLVHWGPRTLDLDIVFYDNEIIDSEKLTIPHKEMHKRNFVLEPMNQIAPWFRHPIKNKTIEELLEDLKKM